MAQGEKIYAVVVEYDNTRLIIIDVSNPLNSIQVGSIDTGGKSRRVETFQRAGKIYALVAQNNKGIRIFEITDPFNPVLTGSIDTEGLAVSVGIMEKDAKIYAVVADQGIGLVLVQIKFSLKYRNYFSPQIYSQTNTPGEAYEVEIIKILGKIYALVADSGEGISIFELTDLQNPVLVSTLKPENYFVFIRTIVLREKIYAVMSDWDKGFKIIEITDPQNPIQVGSIYTDGRAGGLSIMEKEAKFYAVVGVRKKGLKIIEITNPQSPELVGSIITNDAYEVIIVKIESQIYAVVADGNTNLKIIEVTDPHKPVQVGSIDTFLNNWSVSIMEQETKIYAVVGDEIKYLNIIEITDPKNPVLISIMDFKGKTGRITTFELRGKFNALVLNRESGLCIVDLTDVQKPEIIYSIEVSGEQRSVSMIEIDQIIYAVIGSNDAGLSIIKITDNIALYPIIKSNINLQIREFTVNLYPIYMKSLQAFMGENILLSLSLIKPKKKVLTPIPYWVSVDFGTKAMNFIPVSKESLETLQYVFYTFSTKVKTSELGSTSSDKTSEMVVDELISKGYLDNHLFLTNSFNIDKDLLINSNFDKTVIKNKLAQYYHEGYFELMMEDFLELNKSPTIKEGELQREFNEQNNKTKVTQKIDFQFSEFAFIDPDGDLLTYRITNISKIDAQGNITNGGELPLWLNFDRSTRRFQGIPGIQDLGVYTINVTASDKYLEAFQNFTISLTNNAPTVQEEIPEEQKSLKLGSRYDYIFSGSLFNDSNSDILNYQAKIIYTLKGNNTQIKQLLKPDGDFWMKFDTKTRRFTGTPGPIDIEENSEGFDQIFTIQINATDIAEESVSKEFNLRVTRLYPKQDKDQNIQDQLEGAIQEKTAVLKVGGKFDFAFNDKTFISQDLISYRLQLREALINSSQFGNWINITQVSDHWLYFDGQNRRIYGIPKKKDLKKYELKVFASDGYKEIEQLLAFQIINKVPIVQSSINNQIKEMYINEPFEFQFDQNSFNDIGDTLSYIAQLTNGEALPKWLTFKPEERKFEGTPKKFDDIKVRVIATDLAGVTVYDDFDIKVVPSFTYVISQLIYYASVFLTLLGLLKNRIKIYELFCKKIYQYQRVEEAYVGEEYTKKIYLIKEDIENVQKLWKKLEENTISEFKLSRNDWFQKGYMNEQVVDQEKLYEALYQTFPGAKMMIENMSDKKDIMNGMIANILIQNDQTTYNIYKKFKNSSSYYEIDNKRIYSPQDWYRKYILIKQNELEELQTIYINDEQLEKQLQLMNIVEQYEKQLLIDKILADARGIDKLSSWQSSYGENIHINLMDIVKIKVKAQIQDTIGNGLGAGTLRTLYDFAKLNYKDIPMIDKGQIPRWLNVQIEQKELRFKGLPLKEDKGQLMIQIMGDGNILLREFFIRVSEKQQTEIEMLQMKTLNDQKNQENKSNCDSSDIQLISFSQEVQFIQQIPDTQQIKNTFSVINSSITNSNQSALNKIRQNQRIINI